MTSFSPVCIEAVVVEHPLRRDRIVVSHAGRHDLSRFLTVSIEDAGGARGYGEAATVCIWSGETAETARHLVQSIFAPLLIGARFDHPREALERLDAASYWNPFVKSALDTALWDLWGRMQGRPALDLIADQQPMATVPTRASVGAYAVGETVRIASALWDAGIRTLKFKIGVAGLNDRDRLCAVRDALGPEPIFTVDANSAFKEPEAALAAIEKLLPFNVTLYEQPTARDDIPLLGAVKKRSPVKIMADECVFTPGHLEAALACDAFDVLSLYPGKNGGFTHSLDMAMRVQAAGKLCAIGSNLETDLGQAATAALAAGLKVFGAESIAGDLPATLFYEHSSVTQPLTLAGGRVAVPHGPGFGVVPRCFAELAGGEL